MLPFLGASLTLAHYLLRDTADAEDAVQEAYLQGLRHFRRYRGESARAWILTLVRRICYTWADHAAPFGPGVDPELIDGAVDGGDGPETALVRGEGRHQILRAVDALPLPFREVLVLREIHELPYQEIAEVIGVPMGTVMSRLARARRRLLRTLEAQGAGGWR